MIKLIRYLKKYAFMLIFAVVLLFGQAILDLNIPNMMSNIVNTGIQKSGIAEVAPKAVSPDVFYLLTLFMHEDDQILVENAYTLYSELTPAEQTIVDKTFPYASGNNAMVLTSEGDAVSAVDTAMGRAGYAFLELVQKNVPAGTANQEATTKAELDFSQLKEVIPLLMQLPESAYEEVIAQAATAPDTLTNSIAAVLNKAFYQELGADTGAMQTSYIVQTGIYMLLLSLAVVICAVGAGYFFSRLGAGVARDLRRDVFGKVSGFTNAELDRFSTSSLITRTTNDVTQVQMMYTMAMRMMIYAPIMGIGGIIMAVRKSAGMSWIIAVSVFLIIAVILVLYVVVMPRFKKMQTYIDRLNLVARENLTGIMVIRAFGTQDFQEDRFDKANKDLTSNSLFVGRAMVLMMPVMMLIMNGVSLMILWLGADQIATSQMQIGDMLAFMQYSMQIIMSFLFIAFIFIMVPRASVSAERINEVLISESIVTDPKNPKTLSKTVSGVVEFKNVNFRYSRADEDVLHNISFTAKPGETTAFIGPTGSGKSTLVNLIPRFYDVSEGSITLDGVDLREITQHNLRDNIGYVPQKGLLFSGDIAENLRYGNNEASNVVLREAAEVAQATEFIDSSEDGFQTEISQGGTNISGGQRQRLSIARALVKKAPVYIFDDSFSALDFATDARLRKALKPYTRQSAVLIVAQRVSSIMHAEQIVVMDSGRVVGIGTHQELLKSCPTYREIAESQLSKEELA